MPKRENVLVVDLEDEEEAKSFWMNLVHKQSFFSFRDAMQYREEIGERGQIRKVGELYVVFEQ